MLIKHSVCFSACPYHSSTSHNKLLVVILISYDYLSVFKLNTGIIGSLINLKHRYAILFSRYHAIVYPLNALTVSSKSRTRKIIAATWVIPIFFATPYLFCRSYAFNIHGQYGSVSRQICNDRFDEIDQAIYGEEAHDWGSFRKGFFLFLFVGIYLIPLVVIVTTCVRIAMCLLKPIHSDRQESTYGMRMTRRREESKRRVSIHRNISFYFYETNRSKGQSQMFKV